MNSACSPIGFFDSGAGGLSVWLATVALLPCESTVYFADNANCPYGDKPPERVLELSRGHVRRLLAEGCKLIVVACNTATAAAIDTLRKEWPDVPFVGMEPAVKPAALHSKSGVVGVLATAGTFNGRLYRETCGRFAKDVTVLTVVADEFVRLVERGVVDGAEAEASVRRHVEPLLAAGADQIVLGCTHFPFLAPLIRKIAGGRAEVLDPSPAVAEQVRRILVAKRLECPDGNTPVHRLIHSSEKPPTLLSRYFKTSQTASE